jgi:hypothetical protein
MYEEAHKEPEGERARRTAIVDELFEVGKKPRTWTYHPDKPMFTEAKKRCLMNV